MTIKEKINQNSGKKEFEVYAQAISKIFPHIRKQKRKTRVDSLAKAKRIEAELQRACLEEVLKEEAKGNCWAAIVNKWSEFEHKSPYSTMSNETREDYLSCMRIWTKSFWDTPASTLTKSDIRGVIETQKDQGKSKSYQAKTKQIIKRIFDFGVEEGLIQNVQVNPAIGIKISRKSEKPPEVLNIQQVRKLLELAKEHRHPWYPVWAMAVLTGCRNGELYALTWDDVDFTDKRITISKSYNTRHRIVKSTKAGYWRNVPMNKDLEKLLIDLKNTSFGRQEVLPRLPSWDKGNQAKVLRSFLELAGLPSVKFHTLRACFATLMLQQNVPSATVMKICGWKDFDTMARYVRLAAIDEKGATDCLHVMPKLESDNLIEFAGN